MFHAIALYAALADPRWDVRDASEAALVRLVDRYPSLYGPRLAEWAREATEPEIRARVRRPLIVYTRWKVNNYVPSTAPVWPIVDAMVFPTQWGDVRAKWLGMEWYCYGASCDAGCECGPYWHRYRKSTERMVRRMIQNGATYAEMDDLVGRMWAQECAANGDCKDQWPAASKEWVRWEGGYPRPRVDSGSGVESPP